ncbi:ribonuclease HII [Candidatus Saccharibacteria bacterium 32-49-12]|nr:MAG: ribonuclease HII [Candidatus Saccharibacteria bacterium 32-49-12]
MILGIDEAGRGPWAGPLVVGAVVLGGVSIEGLTDSKKLTKKKRDLLYQKIIDNSVAHATGWVEALEIDELGLGRALRLATIRAVGQIKVPYSEIIIDGTVNFLAETGKGKYVQTMAKADLLIPSVSAASILAKVERDRYMAGQDEVYPGYGFAGHSGYGVAKHREAIEKLGITPLHRLSFAPLAAYRSSTLADSSDSGTSPESVTSKLIGNKAEQVVADFLAGQGHVIHDRNWKTRWCEIDIVSKKDDTVFFTEVKYRKAAQYGSGLEAITKSKLRQMKFAAEFYALNKQINGNIELAAASVSGDDFKLEQWLRV